MERELTMRRYLPLGLFTILVCSIVACGGGEISPMNAPQSADQPRPSVLSFSRATADAVTTHHIYVTSDENSYLQTFTIEGKVTKPTIKHGLSEPTSVFVDAHGKLYVANYEAGTVTCFKANGQQTTPTITGLANPYAVYVDAKGKIYVVGLNVGTVTAYTPNGTPTTPTISGLSLPSGVWVDRHGKIYVVQGGAGSVTTYKQSGAPTVPTITAGLNQPAGIVVTASKIFVSNQGNNSVTSYGLSGKRNGLTIVDGISLPENLAFLGNTLYVANQTSGEVTAYDGKTGKKLGLEIHNLTSGLIGLAVR